MDKIKVALIFENKETAMAFVYEREPLCSMEINTSGGFVYDTLLFRYYWIKPFITFKGFRINYVYTTKDIYNTEWFDRVIRPMFVQGIGICDEDYFGGNANAEES